MTRSAKRHEPSRSAPASSLSRRIRRALLCAAADKTVKSHWRTSSVRMPNRTRKEVGSPEILAICRSSQLTQALEARFPGGAVRHFAVAEKGAQAIECAASASKMKTPRSGHGEAVLMNVNQRLLEAKPSLRGDGKEGASFALEKHSRQVHPRTASLRRGAGNMEVTNELAYSLKRSAVGAGRRGDAGRVRRPFARLHALIAFTRTARRRRHPTGLVGSLGPLASELLLPPLLLPRVQTLLLRYVTRYVYPLYRHCWYGRTACVAATGAEARAIAAIGGAGQKPAPPAARLA